MAIEFNCPYCTAPIRVPDAYSGKRGSCPKCATKLLVPDVAPPKQKTETADSTPPAASDEVGTAAPAESTNETPPVPAAAADAAGPDLTTPDEFAVPNLTTDSATEPSPQFAPPTGSSTLSRKLKRKQRRKKAQRVYAIGIPVVCFLLFFGVVAALTFFGKKELKGTLRAVAVPDLDLQEESVAVATFGLSPDEEAQTYQAFEAAPESFTSAQMRCTISLKKTSLEIGLKPTQEFAFFALSPAKDTTLMEWIRDHRTAINRTRLKNLTEIGAELCRDKIKKASGTPIAFDAETYRDGFGLSAHVGAFGYVVEAVTTNRRSRCVHEDTNGTLYFILPKSTTSFTLRGRRIGNAKPLFPGEYKVEVEAKPAPDDAPADEDATTPSNESPETDPGMNEEGDSDDMETEPEMDAQPAMTQ